MEHPSGSQTFPVFAALLTALGVALPASAQDMDEILVTGSRLDSQISDPARQITALDAADIAARSAGASNMAEVLAQAVPGMAPASQTLTNYAQTLRGRKVLVLVDGVPLNTNRDTSRDLYNIDPEQIERIEVLRGGNSLYGSGATGGVIAITTRRGRGEFSAQSSLSANTALTESGGDSTSYKVAQSLSGAVDSFDYSLTATVEQVGAYYDADGDRIAPEPSQGDMFDADVQSLGFKLGYEWQSQRLQFTGNRYQAEQDTDYASDPSVTAFEAGTVKGQSLRGLQLSQQNEIENQVLSLDYYHSDLLQSQLHAQVYTRDYQTRFYPFDARHLSSWGNQIAQSHLNSETTGGRLTLTTPLAVVATGDTELVWGADLTRETTEMPVTLYDGDAFDLSDGLVFAEMRNAVFMPPIDHDSNAAFAQLRHRFNDLIAVDAGLRYEEVEASLDDFVTLAQINDPAPQVISGGSVSYDDWFYNAGIIFNLSADQEIYLSYNEGFELPDIGLQVRYAPTDFNLDGSDLQPLATRNYELGWRGQWSSLQASAAVFRSTSDLGRATTENFGLSLARNEERIVGLEAALDYSLDEAWMLGGTFSALDGEERTGGSGDFVDMNGFRVPPEKLTAYLSYAPSETQSYRLQVLHSGSEDYRLNGTTAFGRRKVDSYTTLDFTGQWLLGPARLSVGLENLLNEDYYPLYGQLLRSGNNTSHIPARGRQLSAALIYNW